MLLCSLFIIMWYQKIAVHVVVYWNVKSALWSILACKITTKLNFNAKK